MRCYESRIRQPVAPLLPKLDQVIPIRPEAMEEDHELLGRPGFGSKARAVDGSYHGLSL
jgi:hypothetical protein